jgi:hypothetical protein
MRAQDENGCDLKDHDQDSGNGEPNSLPAGQLKRSEDRHSGTPGEEKILGDRISHKERRKTWVVPDPMGRRRQRADGLPQWAHGHEQE